LEFLHFKESYWLYSLFDCIYNSNLYNPRNKYFKIKWIEYGHVVSKSNKFHMFICSSDLPLGGIDKVVDMGKLFFLHSMLIICIYWICLVLGLVVVFYGHRHCCHSSFITHFLSYCISYHRSSILVRFSD
jgi:hypothetical protein